MKNKESNTVSINCDVHISRLEYWKGNDASLPANETYSLAITYPFNKPAIFDIKTGDGVGFIKLLSIIKKCYDKKYAAAENDDEDGYWHGIEDLVIEGIKIDHKNKRISLSIGS